MFSSICITFMLAPPCLGPLREPSEAEMEEYVSVPVEVARWVVKVEALPPPWSAWRVRHTSRTFASKSENPLSFLKTCKMFCAVEYSDTGLCMTSEPSFVL